jgi:glycerophosphoryl diester phosphodiesterase
VLVVATGFGAAFRSAAAAAVTPLPQAHAHNDYEHARPLLDALDQGFCSVEADVWIVDGQLLVAHDRKDLRPDRTLQRLYLDPLMARVRAGNGRVHRGGPTFTLLIDAKTDATNTYVALRRALVPYHAMLTRFTADRTETNAILAILSGNRPRGLMASESERWIAYDGRLPDLDSQPSAQFMPMISDNWPQHFTWKGTAAEGPLPELERKRLEALVRRAHAGGHRLRFWGMPDTPLVWETLRAAGVDYINTDDLAGLARFLRSDKLQTPPSQQR